MNITEKLLKWYEKNKRELPWRLTKDPYAVWVSEIMLQQTRVDTAIDYYRRFMEKFRDVRALALAGESEVLNVWKGLGYYSRARNMMRAAKEIVKKYGGVFPGEYGELIKLPGIGAYTAGAVMSIAYGVPAPAVDGNVMRVISRLFALEGDIGKPAAKREIEQIVGGMIPHKSPGDFTQAVMELGALVCVPDSPNCGTCPLQKDCRAFETGLTKVLPVKGKRAESPVVDYWVLAIRQGDRLLMQFREKETLLGRMWGFPMLEKTEEKSPEVMAAEIYGMELKGGRLIGEVKHIFTHRTWHMTVLEYAFTGGAEPSGLRWVSPDELESLPVPTAFRKVLKTIVKNL